MKYLLLLPILLMLTACPLDPKVDGSSEEAMQKSIKSVMKDLNPEKQTEFQDSMKMIMFADINGLGDLMALGQNKELFMGAFMAKVDGKTADEIIALGKTVKAKKAGNDEKSNNETTDSASLSELKKSAQSDATVEMLKKTVSVTLKSKKYVKYNYEDGIDITLSIQNNGDKDIKGIKGLAHFKDMFGDKITSVNLSYDSGVKAGKTAEYNGTLDYNQFDAKDKKLAGIETKNIDFSFTPTTIIFEDGTKISSEDNAD